MSENIKYSPFMSETEIKNLSVTALSNRPNERSGQYGKKGLTPEQLKAAFSALPEAIAERLNRMIPQLVSETVGTVEVSTAEGDPEKGRIVFKSVSGKVLFSLDLLEIMSKCWPEELDGEEAVPATAKAVKSYVDNTKETLEKELKSKAVVIPEYDEKTGVLSFLTLDGENEVSTPALIGDVSEGGSVPPTADAVKDFAVSKLDYRLPKDCADATYVGNVYGINTEGEQVPVFYSVSGAAGNVKGIITLVARNDDGYLHVFDPIVSTHPVSKNYFDTKTNNSLYGDLVRAESRLANLEHVSNGKLYSTEVLNGSGDFQVGEALPYGILSRLWGAVKTVSVGLPYNLDNDTKGLLKKTYDSFVVLAGGMAFVPCDIPLGTTVTVSYEIENSTVNGYYLSTTPDTKGLISGKNNRGESCTATAHAKYIGFNRSGGTVDCEISNFRMKLDKPSLCSIETVVDELEIPETVTSIVGYGEGDNYLDLTERKFCNPGGIIAWVTSHLSPECDVFSLLPGSIVKFTDADGKTVNASYSFSYKNKINI